MLGGQSSNVTCSSGQVFGSARTLKADGISGFIWAFSSIESNQLSKKRGEDPAMMLVLWGLLFPLPISLFPSMLHLLLPWWLGILCWLSRYVPFAVQAKYRPPYSVSWLLVSVRIFFFQLVIVSRFYKILLDGNLIAVTWKLHSYNWCFENKASFFGVMSTSLI